jgi:DNA-directed RNA polymerase sigma subunit (sigma70/sigma32)
MLDVVSIGPYSRVMTPSPDAARRTLIASLDAISDPAERLKEVITQEEQLKGEFKGVRARIALELKDGRTWDQVGEIFGVTGSRAEQISRASR